jgi:hypothetical protein
MKPRKPISKMSARLKADMREYRKLKREYLKYHTTCQGPCAPGTPSQDVHHKRGRIGRLLCEVNHWLPVCRGCHDWIHKNIEEARKLGLICEPGQWNVYAP